MKAEATCNVSTTNTKGAVRNYTDIAINFAKHSLEDNKRTGKMVKLACARFLRDLKDPRWDYRPEYVDRFCDFFEKLPPPSGEQFGTTMTMMDFQVFFVANTEGFRRKDKPPNGLPPARRFNTAALWTARKCGKSTLAAVYGLHDLTLENRLKPLVLTMARTEEQAMLIMQSAIDIANRDADLIAEFSLKVTGQLIERMDERGGLFKAISGKAQAQDGPRPTMAFIDEIHAIEDPRLYRLMRTAFGTSYSWLFLMPSTAGDSLTCVGRTQFNLQQKILKGELEDEATFTLQFVPDDGDDPYSMDTWYKACPALGITIQEDYYKQQAAAAKVNKQDEQYFITRHCNLWKGGGLDRWLQDEWVASCAVEEEIDLKKLRGNPCYIGVDLSERNDLTAICVLFHLEATNELIAGFEVYCPADTIRLRDDEGFDFYEKWRDSGALKVCGDVRIDYEQLAERLQELHALYVPKSIVVDQFAGVHDLGRLVHGYARSRLVMLQKTATNITDSCRDLESRFASGQGLRFSSNPVAEWCMLNAHVQSFRNESLLPIKQTAESDQKIDALDALIAANAARIFGNVGRPIEKQFSGGRIDIPVF